MIFYRLDNANGFFSTIVRLYFLCTLLTCRLNEHVGCFEIKLINRTHCNGVFVLGKICIGSWYIIYAQNNLLDISEVVHFTRHNLRKLFRYKSHFFTLNQLHKCVHLTVGFSSILELIKRNSISLQP